MDESILIEQDAYYRARAPEYDEWHLRQGRYDRGEDHKRQWFSELSTIRKALLHEKPFGECLELACGTGLWTECLAKGASSLTAVDAAPEAIEINRTKTGDSIQFEVADLFEWQPSRRYDFVFFGFWLSHIPLDRFDRFWKMVHMALKQDGKVFFVDSLQIQDSTARDHIDIDDSGTVERKLNDGRSFTIVKVFHDPAQLKKQLETLGFRGWIQRTESFFYYGCMTVKNGQQDAPSDAYKLRS